MRGQWNEGTVTSFIRGRKDRNKVAVPSFQGATVNEKARAHFAGYRYISHLFAAVVIERVPISFQLLSSSHSSTSLMMSQYAITW